MSALRHGTLVVLTVALGAARALSAQQVAPSPATAPDSAAHDSVSIRLMNTELRSAVQIMGQYLDRPVVFSGATAAKVTLETPHPVPRSDVVRMLRGLLESQGYELVSDTTSRLYRAEPKPTAEPERRAASAPASPANAPELFVIPLKHARAVDVAQTVNALYGRATSFLGSRSLPMTLSDQLQQNLVAPVGAPLPESVPGTAGRSANLTGNITIVPDAGANSLLVRANRSDFGLIQAVVEQLDVRPLEVLIEVTIAEVQRNRTLSIGVDATLNSTTVGRNGASITGVAGNGVQTGTTGSSGTTGTTGTGGLPGGGDFALQVMRLGAFDLNARLRVDAERGDVKILSQPVVVVANNQQAQIVVGSQRPFVQVARTLPTDNAVQDQVVQYKDVGTKLSVSPTIGADGLVQLEVSQEVSNATTETAFNAPVISTRSVQTQLLIKDGQTVALGGLTDHENDASRGGVPILSAIPIIGGLFGHASRETDETELFIFLTPHVIRSDAEADSVSAPYRDRARKIKP